MANGNFAGGNGSANNPYLIEDAWDLNAIRNKDDAHYKLISDIDLNVLPFNDGEGWEPINYFRGTLDGNGYSIKNLYINTNSRQGGLFRRINGTIKNLLIVNPHIYSEVGHIGALAGSDYFGKVENVGVIGGKIQSTDSFSYAGGLVGRAQYARYYNCFTNCTVEGIRYVGGLFGLVNYFVSKLYSSFSCSAVIGSQDVGGLAGRASNTNVSQFKDSFWDIEASGQTTSAIGIGLTTQQMKTAQTFIDAGWHEKILEDGTFVWKLKDGEYPKLWFEKSNKIFFYTDEGYKIYKNSEWITVLTNYPSIEEFREYGMKNLDRLTNKEFRKLKSDRVKIIVFKEA